jgi:ATP-binding cassette subfamily B protein
MRSNLSGKTFFKKPFPFIRQSDSSDCGLACLRMLGRYFNIDIAGHSSFQDASITKQGMLFSELSRVSGEIGFQTLAVSLGFNEIEGNVPLPSVFFWNDNHFIIVYKIRGNTVYAADPAIGKIKYSKTEFLAGWGGKDQKGLILIYLPPANPALLPSPRASEKMNLSKILVYLLDYKTQLSLIVVTLFFSSVFELIFPFFTQKIIDKGVLFRDMSLLQLILLSQVILFMSKIMNEFYRSWLFIHISPRVSIRLVSDFLIKLFSLPLRFFSSKNVGDLLERIQDHKRVENFITNDLLKSIFAFFSVIIYAIVLLHYNNYIFLVFLLGNIIQLSWIFLYLKKISILDQKQFTLLAKEQNKLLELINGMQEIKLNNIEEQRKSGWEKIQEELFQNNILKLMTNQKYEGYRFISFFISILITFIAANAVIKGELTIGSMMAIIFVLGGVNGPVGQLINFILNLQLVRTSLGRLDEVYKLSGDEVKAEPAEDLKIDDIIINDLSFTYDNTDFVLNHIDLIIPKGKTTAIVGVSGSGKTTLLKLILKFYAAQKGSIHIGKASIASVDHKRWRNQCGVIFQDSFIFSESIAYNISLEDTADEDRLEHAMQFANIKTFVEKLPLKTSTVIGIEGMGLSQGQKQRILIARAIYKNPDYLFFDEATNSLDTENEKIIVQNINRYFEGKTMVVVAHRLSTVKNADQIIVLDKGTIIERGSHPDLVKLGGKYLELIRNQLELGN